MKEVSLDEQLLSLACLSFHLLFAATDDGALQFFSSFTYTAMSANIFSCPHIS